MEDWVPQSFYSYNPDAIYTLWSYEFVNKYGFDDGNTFDSWYHQSGMTPPGDREFRDRMLWIMATQHVVPVLRERGFEAELIYIGSSHNRIRFDRVNGDENFDYEANPDFVLAFCYTVEHMKALEAIAGNLKNDPWTLNPDAAIPLPASVTSLPTPSIWTE